ncbi:hypothetical protein JCM8097_006036 [Rhodosporidiobolus ruineniae]
MAHRLPVNDDPFAAPNFLAGLEAAGYLQRLDTSEKRITERYQHALAKMQFAAHSEEFLTRAGVRKVHRSTVQFFNENPVSDPFVHVMVGSLPPSAQAFVEPRGCLESVWTPIRSPDEADDTIHFTVSHDGFWPLTVVFDVNQADLFREDKYAGLDDNGDSASSSEDDLPGSGAGRAPSSRRSTRQRGMASSASQGYGGYSSGAAGGASGAGYYGSSSASRSGCGRQASYAANGAGAGDDSSSSSGSESGGENFGRGGGGLTGSAHASSQRAGSTYGGAGSSYGGAGTARASSRNARRQNTGGMSASAIDAAMAGLSMSASGRASRASNAAAAAASAAGAGQSGRASRASRRGSAYDAGY